MLYVVIQSVNRVLTVARQPGLYFLVFLCWFITSFSGEKIFAFKKKFYSFGIEKAKSITLVSLTSPQ